MPAMREILRKTVSSGFYGVKEANILGKCEGCGKIPVAVDIISSGYGDFEFKVCRLCRMIGILENRA